MAEVFRAWIEAEKNVKDKIAELLEIDGTHAFVGDGLNDLIGKINCFCFSISGGPEQEHQFESSTECWHAFGNFTGIYDAREKAAEYAERIMREVPITSVENVPFIILRTHPTIRTTEWEVANYDGLIWAYELSITFSIVYTVE